MTPLLIYLYYFLFDNYRGFNLQLVSFRLMEQSVFYACMVNTWTGDRLESPLAWQEPGLDSKRYKNLFEVRQNFVSENRVQVPQ